MLKKLIIVLVAITFTFTLSSCNRHNLHTPTGSITDNIFARAGNNSSITERELYDNLRASHGLDVINEHINRFILEEQISIVQAARESVVRRSSTPTQDEIYEDLVDTILRSIFNTDDLEVISRMSLESRNEAMNRYRDNFFLQHGIELRQDFITFNNGFNIESVYINDARLYTPYEIVVAGELFARNVLNEEHNLETIDEEDNPLFISPEDIEDTFERMLDFGTREAIIITFNTPAQAARLIQQASANTGVTLNGDGFATPSTDQETLNILRFYLELFRLRHGQVDEFTGSLDATLDFISYQEDHFVFTHDFEGNEMLNFGAAFYNEFADMEDFQHTVAPRQFGNQTAMFLRISEYLEFYEIESLDEYEEEFGNTARTALELRIIEEIKDSMVTTGFVNSQINRVIDEDLEITIYDPIIEFLFSRGREDFSFNRSRQNTNVLSLRLNDRYMELSVDDFFEELVERFATEVVTNTLINRWLLSNDSFIDQLPDTADSDFNNAFNNVTRSFRQSDFRPLGLENYLLIQHGFNNRDAVIRNVFKANAVWDIAINDFEAFGLDLLLENNRFDVEGNTMFHFFEQIIEERFNEQFSIGIQHILITIDYDNDGNPDDPLAFYNNLTSAQQVEFTDTIQNLTATIIREAAIFTGIHNQIDRLHEVVRQFNMNGRIYSRGTPAVYWQDEFDRWYNIGLRVEDLGTVTQANVTNFVLPFGLRVRDLHEHLTTIEFDFEEYDEYFETFGLLEGANPNTINLFDNNRANSLTQTVFGFHILNVTEINEVSSARFTQDMDWRVGDELRLENINVVLNPNAPESEQRIGIADAYSGPEGSLNDNPSASQLFVWFFESQRSGGATSGNTSVRNTISSLFNPVINQFNNSNFQTWRFIQHMPEIEIVHTGSADLMDKIEFFVETILVHQFHNYEMFTNPAHYTFGTWFETYRTMFL